MSAVIGHQYAHQQPQQPDKFTELVNKDNGDKFTELDNNDNGDKFTELVKLLDELRKWAGLHWMECL